MPAYYNENDPKAAAWLRELIKAGRIARGDVDERSIEDVTPMDVAEYTQCHFFAGIGGWSYALRLAGWSDSRAVWTGSCPCQPFSTAGKGAGFADERHLWPAFFHLISQSRPPTIFGEQVANALAWFDLVSGDLENEAYAVGGAIVGAHSVGAPHIRQRLYWVAESKSEQRHGHGHERRGRGEPSDGSDTVDLAHTARDGRQQRRSESDRRSAVGDSELGDPRLQRRQRRQEAARGYLHDGQTSERTQGEHGSCESSTHWSGAEFIPCIDRKARPVEPGTFPLAHGVSGRVGLLRGYGNAIVPQVAAAFISAYAGTAE